MTLLDYRQFVELLADERARVGMRLAWCLMPNQWHLVLWPRANGELGSFVRRLTQRHTSPVTAASARGAGAMSIRGATRSSLIQDDAHLIAVCHYVERNPLRAGLVASAAAWPHGSLAELRLRGAARLLDPWPIPRPSRWTELVDRPETPQELDTLRRSVLRGAPFGDPRWVPP